MSTNTHVQPTQVVIKGSRRLFNRVILHTTLSCGSTDRMYVQSIRNEIDNVSNYADSPMYQSLSNKVKAMNEQPLGNTLFFWVYLGSVCDQMKMITAIQIKLVIAKSTSLCI